MNLSLTLWAACLATVSIIVNAFPKGGSSLNGYCGNLTPGLKADGIGHKGIATKATKFEITTNETALDVGQSMTVTVKKSAAGTDNFMGFLCIVSLAVETKPFLPKGTMSETKEAKFTTTVDCKGATATGASHFNADPGTSRKTHDAPATFVWTAPAYAKANEEYKLRCTIVQNKDHAFTDYEKTIQVKQGGVAPTTAPDNTSTAAFTTTQKSSSPRNMASDFIILASIIIVVMEKSG